MTNHPSASESGKQHDLKTDPAVFAAVLAGEKTHEIRFNDRGFAVGDLLLLRETVSTGADMAAGAPLEYTGGATTRTVSHIQTGYGLADGWCILSFAAQPVAAPTAGDALPKWLDHKLFEWASAVISGDADHKKEIRQAMIAGILHFRNEARAALANQPAPTVPATPVEYMTWWTSIETDLRKSLLIGAGRDRERLHDLLRTAYEAGQAAHQPAQEQAEPVAWAFSDGLARLARVRDGFCDSPLLVVHATENDGYTIPLYAAPQAPVAAAPDALLAILHDVHDTLSSESDSDIDHFEDDEEEREGAPVQYAARKVMEVIDLLNAAATSAPCTPEAPKKPAHGHRDDYYLLANGRRLGLEPISRVRHMPNWVLASELFATGSASAHQICRDAGVDPDACIIERAAIQAAQGEKA